MMNAFIHCRWESLARSSKLPGPAYREICRLRHEYDLCLRIQRIISREVSTLDDINVCRLEIMRQHPEYE